MNANIIVIIILSHYTIYTTKLIFSKTFRKERVAVNEELDKIRDVPAKTLEEQKRFLNAKFPPVIFKWTPKGIAKMIVTIAVYIVLIRYIMFWLIRHNIIINFWQAILFAIFFPLIYNQILSFFRVQNSDLRQFFKWGD